MKLHRYHSLHFINAVLVNCNTYILLVFLYMEIYGQFANVTVQGYTVYVHWDCPSSTSQTQSMRFIKHFEWKRVVNYLDTAYAFSDDQCWVYKPQLDRESTFSKVLMKNIADELGQYKNHADEVTRLMDSYIHLTLLRKPGNLLYSLIDFKQALNSGMIKL